MPTHGNIGRLTLLLVTCAMAACQPACAADSTDAAAPAASEEAGQAMSGSAEALHSRSSVLSGLSLTTQLRSDSQGAEGGTQVAASYLVGHLALQRYSERSGFVLNYEGGGFGSTGSSGSNGLVQALDFSQTFTGRRFFLSLGGSASYLPESSFGFGWGAGFTNPSVSSQPIAGSGVNLIPEAAAPDQSILTLQARRLSGVVHTTFEYRTSRRSSWTATGSYGRLQFAGGGFVNSAEVQFQGGYSYQATRKNSLSTEYGFHQLQFAGVAPGINEHRLSVSFLRRLSDKTSVQASAGPSLSLFQSPSATAQVSYRVSGAVTHTNERGSLGLSYDRALTGGSGVLLGAQTNLAQVTAQRVLTRAWQGSTSLGYATNRSVAEMGVGASSVPLRSWYGDAKIARRMDSGSLFLGYGIRSQSGYAGACTGAGCGSSFIVQQLSLGFNWNFRSLAL